jgi:RNA-directed DNA polymerase
MSLTTPSSVQKLQTALHAKAKEASGFRLYALYDKVYRKDILAFAYQCCKENGGVAGVDGQTFANIEQYGVERWVDELAQELKSRTYRPLPVRRVYILKPEGKQRPLGIPVIRDRWQKRRRSWCSNRFSRRTCHLSVCLSARPQRTGRGERRP